MRHLPTLPSYVLAAELARGRPVVELAAGSERADDALGMAAPVGIVIDRLGPWRSNTPNVLCVRAEPERAPLRDGSAGAVLCAHLVSMDPDRREMLLREARRLAGTDGVLVAPVPAESATSLLALSEEGTGWDTSELQRLVRPYFAHVALFGQEPFLAYLVRRLAYSDDEQSPLSLHRAFALGGGEAPAALLAVCGARYRRLDGQRLVELPYRPFDDAIRSRIDELADRYQGARADAARARHMAGKAVRDLERVRPEAGRAADAARRVCELEEANSSLESELHRLKARVRELEAELDVVVEERAQALERGSGAERRATEATASVERMTHELQGAVLAQASATQETNEQRARGAELRRQLDTREEEAALLREERDRAAAAQAELQRRLGAVSREREQERATAASAEANARAAAAAVDVARTRLGVREREIEELRRDIEEKTARVDRLEHALRQAQDERATAAATRARIESELFESRAELEVLKAPSGPLGALELDLEQAHARVAELGRLLEERGAQLKHAETERELAIRSLRELDTKLEELELGGRELSELRRQLAAVEDERIKARAAAQRATERAADLEATGAEEREQFRRTRAELEARVAELGVELEEANATRGSIDSQISHLSGELGIARSESQRLAVRLAATEMELERAQHEMKRLRGSA